MIMRMILIEGQLGSAMSMYVHGATAKGGTDIAMGQVLLPMAQ